MSVSKQIKMIINGEGLV